MRATGPNETFIGCEKLGPTFWPTMVTHAPKRLFLGGFHTVLQEEHESFTTVL